MEKYGVKMAVTEGHLFYDSKSFYKLYIYGNRKVIRSSRELAESSRVNIEARWMTDGAESDFRMVSDFRENNIDRLEEIFQTRNRTSAYSCCLESIIYQ